MRQQDKFNKPPTVFLAWTGLMVLGAHILVALAKRFLPSLILPRKDQSVTTKFKYQFIVKKFNAPKNDQPNIIQKYYHRVQHKVTAFFVCLHCIVWMPSAIDSKKTNFLFGTIGTPSATIGKDNWLFQEAE